MARVEKQLKKDGKPRYKAIIRRKGAPMRTKTFGTRAQADAWGRKMDALIDDRKTLPNAEGQKNTVNELVLKYTHRFPLPSGVLGGNLSYLDLTVTRAAKENNEARLVG